MDFIVVIPSRYASTRLPGKALIDIHGKTLIERVVDRANLSNASRVIVATDDQRIVDALSSIDCEVCLTNKNHISGSDRLAEVMQLLSINDQTIVVNVQGDEPLIPIELINQVAETLQQSPDATMSTAAHLLTEQDEIENPNNVKVVFDHSSRALYFSRSPIPFDRNVNNLESTKYWKHVGIYAYRAEFLKRYHRLKPSELEQSESLEQLRVLDNGESIIVKTVDYDAGIGVDTVDDLELVRKTIEQSKL